jgi:LPXTG-motif cell wall-anchored protein
VAGPPPHAPENDVNGLTIFLGALVIAIATIVVVRRRRGR